MSIINLGDGGFFDTVSLESDSGTGNYSTILRVQNTGDEQGFNTDENGVVLDNKASFTSAIQFSALQSVTINSVDYYVFRFDLNQSSPDITLESLQIYGFAAPATLSNFTNSTGVFGTTPVYSFSGSQVLSEGGSGSGHDDGGFYIPVSLFSTAGLTGSDYLTLYADFSGANGGFEEFRALTAPGTPGLTVLKTATIDTGDGLLNSVGDTIDYTITVTNNGNVALSNPNFVESLSITLTSTDVGGANVGDINHDHVFDPGEAWVYSASYAITQGDLDTGGNVLAACGTFENTVTASAIDLSNALLTVHDTDFADVQLTLQAGIAIDKTAVVLNFDNTTDSDNKVDAVGDKIAYSFAVTNAGNTALDGVSVSDPLLAGYGVTVDQVVSGGYNVGDTDHDGRLDVGETWSYTATLSVTQSIFDTAVAGGDVLTNTATASGVDCCLDPASGQDSATVDFLPPVNTARTPGFWYNNGSLLWDGDSHTLPKAGNLGFNLGVNGDLAYAIKDLDGNGSNETPAGNTGYLMIGDWNRDGIADNGENVLVVSRSYALSVLNASTKQVQDGRFLVARDLVAAWLNNLGGTPVGSAQDPDSVRHYIDEATAWLIQTTNGDHVLANNELSAPSPVPTSSSPWQTGYNFGGTSAWGENMVPPVGSDILGSATSTDILAGSVIHSGLDHFNNFGFI